MRTSSTLRGILENFFRQELGHEGLDGPAVVNAFRVFLRELGVPLGHGAPVHAHVYFDAGSYSAAEALRRDFAAAFSSLCQVGPLGPASGPHPLGNFEVGFELEMRAEIVEYLKQHRGSLSVLIHEVRGDDVNDHTRGIEWLGAPLDLDLSAFAS